MVLRSCLCYKKCHFSSQKRTLTLYIRQQQQQQQNVLNKSITTRKYPGLLLHYPQQRMFTTSVNSVNNQIEKIDFPSIITSPSSKLLDNNKTDLERVLNNELTIKQAKSFYRRWAKTATPKDIYNLISLHLEKTDYHHLRKVLLDAAAFWSGETIQEVMSLCSGDHVKWRLDLLNLLLSGYVIDRNLNPLLSVLPDLATNERKNILPFYNAVLNKCLKQKEFDHVRNVVDLMKERQIDPDTATFNILIRMKLVNSSVILDPKESFAIYTSMITQGIQPNHATFNTFIKHACSQQQWDTLNTWLDMMEEDGIEPNPVTSRVLFHSYVNNPTSIELSKAFDRVSTAVPLSEKERFLNTGVSALLKTKQTKAAMDLLDKTFAIDEPLSIYSYNLLIRALCLDGKLENAKEVLDSMISQDQNTIPKPDIVSFTTVMHGLVRDSNHIQLNQLNTLYKQLMDQGLRTNNVLESVMLYGLVRSDNNDNLTKAKIMFESIMANKSQVKLPRQHGDKTLDDIQIYNMMMDFYFLHYHKSKSLKNQTPQEPFALLNDAVENKKLKPTTTTLNILVRGLAILNKDLAAAEKMVTLLAHKGVQMNEKTAWYLTKSAYKQGQMSRARNWIEKYESQNRSIKGPGLLHLKSILTKWVENDDKDEEKK